MRERDQPMLGDDPTLCGDEPTPGLPAPVDREPAKVSGRVAPPVLGRGDAVGRYVILERVGSGGMGVVYAAWDPDLDRKVALKLLHANTQIDQAKREDQNQRLLREAQAMARISHPNVITVHDVGERDGRVFVAMEFIEGKTLGAWLQERERPIRSLLDVLVRAGRGLAAAHEHGLVHRDFKPDNVMVGDDGRVRVMDFGLVRTSDEPGPEPSRELDLEALAALARPSELAASADDDQLLSASGSGSTPSRAELVALMLDSGLETSTVLDSQLTLDGALLGTPAYMSPEQLHGEVADARSDQFSFCVAVWDSLYGQRPFRGESPLAVLFAVTNGKLSEPPTARRIPGRIRKALERGLSLEPGARWSTMRSLLSALAYDPSRSRGRWLGLGSIVIAVGAAVSASLLRSKPEPPLPPCEGAGAEIDGLWTHARRGSLGERFANSELVFANDSWVAVERNLDSWAEQWRAARRDACEASELRHEQSAELLDLRMACLDRGLGHFDALLNVYAEADAAVIEKAVEASEGLRPLAPCSDRSWLQAALRPPEDPELAAAVEQLQPKIDEVEALIKGGRINPDTLALAEAAEGSALALAWPATIAEASVQLGQVQLELADFEAARASLERAYFEARRCGHDEVTVAAAFKLIYVNTVGFSDFEATARWIEHGLAEGRRIGRDDLLGEVYAAVGIYHYMRDERELTKEAFRESLRLLGDQGDLARGSAQINFGTVLIRSGPSYAAEATRVTREGVALLERTLGAKHPSVAAGLSNYATVCSYAGDKHKAIELLERALDISIQTRGSRHPSTALIQLNLTLNLLEIEGADMGRAHELADASLSSHRELFGQRHQMVAESERAMGRVLWLQGQPELALVHMERAVEIWTALFADQPPMAADMTRVWRAQIFEELGRADEASAELEALLGREQLSAEARAAAQLCLAEQLLGEGRGRERIPALIDEARTHFESRKMKLSLARVAAVQLALD